jgi:hypothetical protein
MTNNAKIHSFAIGDKVEFARRDFNRVGSNKIGAQGHITNVSLIQGVLHYGFEGTSWYPHRCFDLIHRATEESLAYVVKLMRDEDEEDIDDEVPKQIDGSPMDGACCYFAELDKSITAAPRGSDTILVTTSRASLLDIFKLETSFGINVLPPNGVVRIKCDGILLVIKFDKADEATISFYDDDGHALSGVDDGYEMHHVLANRFDPTLL